MSIKCITHHNCHSKSQKIIALHYQSSLLLLTVIAVLFVPMWHSVQPQSSRRRKKKIKEKMALSVTDQLTNSIASSTETTDY